LLDGIPLNWDIYQNNFEGSSQQSSAKGGFILRYWPGKVIKVGVTNYGHSSISWLFKQGKIKITIVGNYQGTIQVPWQITTLIQNTKHGYRELHCYNQTYLLRG